MRPETRCLGDITLCDGGGIEGNRIMIDDSLSLSSPNSVQTLIPDPKHGLTNRFKVQQIKGVLVQACNCFSNSVGNLFDHDVCFYRLKIAVYFCEGNDFLCSAPITLQ